MITVIKEISVDVYEQKRPIKITAKQGDVNSRYVKASITNNSSLINIPSEALVTINAKRLDGTNKVFKGQIDEDGKVLIKLNSWILEYTGIVNCDISISTEEYKITSFEFYIDVLFSPGSSQEVSELEEYDVLTKLIHQFEAQNSLLNEKIAYIDEVINKLENIPND